MGLPRLFKHIIYPPWLVRRYFPPSTLERIEAAIHASERKHNGEIRFAVESSLDCRALFQDEPCRERGIEVFSELRIWDTEENNGVLIYLLLADRDVEIIADRGISSKVDPSEWERICRMMEENFRNHQFDEGVISGIQAIEKLLVAHFLPEPGHSNENQLSNKPVIF